MSTEFYSKLSTEQAEYDLQQLKRLTAEQYDRAREAAIERTQANWGTPTRQQFHAN